LPSPPNAVRSSETALPNRERRREGLGDDVFSAGLTARWTRPEAKGAESYSPFGA